jgi:hypothetical protein
MRVVLHEGRVLITARWAADSSFGQVYLEAGQELAFNENTRLPVVSQGSDLKKAGADQGLAGNGSPGSRKGVSLAFESTPLEKVLQLLEYHYNIKLQYHPEDVQAMAFTGRIQPKDSLALVLHRIALLNNLIVTRYKAGYLIRKNQ